MNFIISIEVNVYHSYYEEIQTQERISQSLKEKVTK